MIAVPKHTYAMTWAQGRCQIHLPETRARTHTHAHMHIYFSIYAYCIITETWAYASEHIPINIDTCGTRVRYTGPPCMFPYTLQIYPHTHTYVTCILCV